MYNDGGRKAAGFKGSTDDCVCRAIAIATGKPYREVYDELNALGKQERTSTKRRGGKSTARTGVHKATSRKYLAELGWIWHPTMQIGSGCRVHLNDRELPLGRLIVAVSGHLCAVIDGVIYDTHNPSDRGATIYPPNYLGNIPSGAKRISNGCWAYQPERCVYGYWTREDR